MKIALMRFMDMSKMQHNMKLLIRISTDDHQYYPMNNGIYHAQSPSKILRSKNVMLSFMTKSEIVLLHDPLATFGE